MEKVRHYVSQLEINNQKLQQEVRDRQKAEAQLVHDALHDSLTGLPNRTLLMKRLNSAIQRIKHDPDYLFALMFIDLDRFKFINDSMGHEVGDKLLIAIAKILQEDLRNSDIVGRLGGDEFVILLSDIQDITDATFVGDSIQNRLSLPLTIENQTLYISASIGIALGLTGYQNSSQILRDADLAMYQAKEKGKACYEIFHQDMFRQNHEQIKLKRDLHPAIKQ